MSDSEPKDRLRAARTKMGLSRERLAQKLGRSASTVRAHENGQNQILPEAATAYARELGVSAAWLLYGTSHEDALAVPGPKTRSIPIVGEIWDRSHFIPHDEIFDSGNEKYFTISLPEYEHWNLSAYIIKGTEFDYYHRRYVIAGEIESESDLSLVDEVIIREREGRLVALGIWKVGVGEPGFRDYYQGPSARLMRKMIRLRTDRSGDAQYEILGMVIAKVEVRRGIEWSAFDNPG